MVAVSPELPRRTVLTDFACLDSARRAWRELHGGARADIRAKRAAFIAACRAQQWCAHFRGTEKNIRKQIVNLLNHGAKLRDTQARADLADARAKLYNFASNYTAPISQTSHSKGAYQERDWMDERAALLGLWDTEEFRAGITAAYGRSLEYATFERIYRSQRGAMTASERAMDKYIQRCVPDAPDYAGQYLQMDGTEIPVDICNAWGRARKDGDVRQIMVALTDVLSLKTWMLVEGNTSEVHLWSPLLMKFFQQAKHAPEKILTDLGGRLFHSLSGQQAGAPIVLDEGLQVALAVGVKPATHTAHNARAKGAVESGGMKAGKSTLKRILVGRVAKALFHDLASVPLDSHGHVAYRQLSSEAEWREIQIAWEQMLNARLVKRVGAGDLQRNGVYALPEYAAKRAPRALVADWEERRRDVLSRAFTMEVRGEKVLYWKGARAEVRTALGHPVEPGAVAVLYPGGLRQGDAELGDELLRGVIIEPKPLGGMPSFRAIEALKVKKSFAGFDLDRPKVNEHPKAIPETAHERQQRLWAETGKVLPAAIREARDAVRVKQATTDDYV